MTAYLARQQGWLTVERLPGYAPEPNPVVGLWSNLKGQQLIHLCAEDLAMIDAAVGEGMARVRRQRHLPFAFLHHAGVFVT